MKERDLTPTNIIAGKLTGLGYASARLFSAKGVTKELPLSLMSGHLRTMRIHDDPTEVHKWVVARNLLGLKR